MEELKAEKISLLINGGNGGGLRFPKREV